MGRFAWFIKAELDIESLVFFSKDYQDNSMLFLNEYFSSICEFGLNKFLITDLYYGMLIVKNWKVTHTIKDSEPGNV